MSNNELVEKYCFNCEVGLYNCKYNLRECPIVRSGEAEKEPEERGEE